jgi:hypothetical protein
MHKVGLDDEGAARRQPGTKAGVGFLKHDHQHVGLGDQGVAYGGIGDNDVGVGRTPAGLGPIGLGEHRLLVVVEAGGLAQQHARKHDALPAEA